MEFKREFGRRIIYRQKFINCGGQILLGLVVALLIGTSVSLILYGSERAVIGGWIVLWTLAGLGLLALVVCRK